MDDVPGLTLSQESTDSSFSTSSSTTSAKTRKRFFVEDEDEDETPSVAGMLNPTFWQDGEVSPRSLAPVGWGNGRVIAVPRTRSLQGKPAVANIVGQENVVIMDDDFQEANFLDRSFEVEMDDV
jgi:hypothetical protein